MTNQLEALIAKIKKQTESFDTVVLKEDEALALIAALEQSQQEKDKWVKWASELGEKCDRLEASQLAVKLPEPDFKKLARGLVDNLVDCGGLDGGVYEQYVIWAEKECRVSFGGTVQGDE